MFVSMNAKGNNDIYDTMLRQIERFASYFESFAQVEIKQHTVNSFNSVPVDTQKFIMILEKSEGPINKH